MQDAVLKLKTLEQCNAELKQALTLRRKELITELLRVFNVKLNGSTTSTTVYTRLLNFFIEGVQTTFTGNEIRRSVDYRSRIVKCNATAHLNQFQFKTRIPPLTVDVESPATCFNACEKETAQYHEKLGLDSFFVGTTTSTDLVDIVCHDNLQQLSETLPPDFMVNVRFRSALKKYGATSRSCISEQQMETYGVTGNLRKTLVDAPHHTNTGAYAVSPLLTLRIAPEPSCKKRMAREPSHQRDDYHSGLSTLLSPARSLAHFSSPSTLFDHLGFNLFSLSTNTLSLHDNSRESHDHVADAHWLPLYVHSTHEVDRTLFTDALVVLQHVIHQFTSAYENIHGSRILNAVDTSSLFTLCPMNNESSKAQSAVEHKPSDQPMLHQPIPDHLSMFEPIRRLIVLELMSPTVSGNPSDNTL